jgi:tetratricopeptide (TPR) repeat protein
LGEVGKNFTPAGGLITHLIFLAAVLPLAIGIIKGQKGQEGSNLKTLKQLGSLIAIVLIAGGLVVGGVNYLKNRSAFRQMPLSTGWQIAVETLKISPFVGTGSNGYLAAFTQYRPVSSNNGDLWNVRFQQAPNEFLQRFTENGILGLAVLLLLIYKSYKTYETHKSYIPSGLGAALAIFGIGLLLEPLNAVALSLLLGLLSIMVLSVKGQASTYDKTSIYDVILGIVTFRKGIVSVNLVPPSAAGDMAPIQQNEKPAGKASLSSILGWVLFVPALAISILVFYFGSRVMAAEIDYRKALVGIAANDGTTAYNQLIKTITQNPWFDTYHRQYADINLRLANSLAAQKNLSDTDRNNVSQLIQQAIREGKIAVQLDSNDVRNWEQLAVIYRALINVADGAKDWTNVAYTEAIRRDPINPLLRLDLGGVFYSLSDWDNAIRTFQTAASLKPDYANAYYNLALAYEQAGKSAEAVKAMQSAVQNLDAKSADYPAAIAKLEELAKRAQEIVNSKQETVSEGTSKEPLTKPEPLPTAGPGANKVDLTPKEAPPVTPTPTTEPTPAPEVNVN